MSEIKLSVQQADDIATLLTTHGAELKLLRKQITEQGAGDPEQKEKLDKLDLKIETTIADIKKTKEQLVEVDAKLNRRTSEHEAETKSPGRLFVESPEYKSYAQRPSENQRAVIEINKRLQSKDITTNPAAVNLLVTPQRVPGIFAIPNVPLLVRSLMPQGETNSNAIQYMKELSITLNVAPQFSPFATSPVAPQGSGYMANPNLLGVADGGLKPSSDIKWYLQNTPVSTLAHWIAASRQILDDAPMLRSEIDNRLMYGLALEEEKELLRGDGTGGKLLGLIPQATTYLSGTYNVSGDTKIDHIRHMMLQVTQAKYLPDGIVTSAWDWHDIELTKTQEFGTPNVGRYVVGDPTSVLSNRLWGLPVVASLSLNHGEAIVAAFQLATQIFDRQEANISVGLVNDQFIRNMLTILCEERVALAVYRPDAIVYYASL